MSFCHVFHYFLVFFNILKPILHAESDEVNQLDEFERVSYAFPASFCVFIIIDVSLCR